MKKLLQYDRTVGLFIQGRDFIAFDLNLARGIAISTLVMDRQAREYWREPFEEGKSITSLQQNLIPLLKSNYKIFVIE